MISFKRLRESEDAASNAAPNGSSGSDYSGQQPQLKLPGNDEPEHASVKESLECIAIRAAELFDAIQDEEALDDDVLGNIAQAKDLIDTVYDNFDFNDKKKSSDENPLKDKEKEGEEEDSEGDEEGEEGEEKTPFEKEKQPEDGEGDEDNNDDDEEEEEEPEEKKKSLKKEKKPLPKFESFFKEEIGDKVKKAFDDEKEEGPTEVNERHPLQSFVKVIGGEHKGKVGHVLSSQSTNAGTTYGLHVVDPSNRPHGRPYGEYTGEQIAVPRAHTKRHRI